MRNKSDLVLVALMMAFLGYFVYKMPNGPGGDFQSTLTANTATFANTVASEYNNADAAGTVTTTDDLTQIAPAAGDKTPDDEFKRVMPQGLMTQDAIPAE